MNYTKTSLGRGHPRVAILGCVHGDEVIGKLVIEKLQGLKLRKGSLTLIIANPRAAKKNSRFLEQDLNRSFPGKTDGCLEEQIAAELTMLLKNQDFILDIHATNSNFNELVLLHHLNSDTKQMLKYLPIKRVAHVGGNIFNGCSLLHCCENAVCLEYGPDKSGRNHKRALRHVRQFLINYEMLPGTKKTFSKKEYYRVDKEYQTEDDFIQAKSLKDFQKIKKGQYLGTTNGQKIYSDKTFYPIFLGKGSYKNTLALMGKKQKLEL